MIDASSAWKRSINLVYVRLKIAAVLPLEQDLERLRPGRLDDPPRERAARDRIRVTAEEALVDLLERRAGPLLEVGAHPRRRLVGQLEVVPAGLRAELALAAVQELGPSLLAEAGARVERDVDREAVLPGGVQEALGELAPLLVA